MAKLARNAERKIHSPKFCCGFSIQFSVQKISQTAESIGKGNGGNEEIGKFQKWNFFCAAENIKCNCNSDETAEIAHSVYSDVAPVIENIKRQKNLRKMILKIIPVVDKNIS